MFNSNDFSRFWPIFLRQSTFNYRFCWANMAWNKHQTRFARVKMHKLSNPYLSGPFSLLTEAVLILEDPTANKPIGSIPPPFRGWGTEQTGSIFLRPCACEEILLFHYSSLWGKCLDYGLCFLIEGILTSPPRLTALAYSQWRMGSCDVTYQSIITTPKKVEKKAWAVRNPRVLMAKPEKNWTSSKRIFQGGRHQ